MSLQGCVPSFSIPKATLGSSLINSGATSPFRGVLAVAQETRPVVSKSDKYDFSPQACLLYINIIGHW